jgi:hypothetical protein
MKFYWFGSFNIDGSKGNNGIIGIISLIKNPIRGWLGQWLDIEIGLLWNGPVFALIIVGIFIWFGKQRSSFLFILPPVFIYMIISASTKVWDGGFSPPARHMLVTLPVLLPAISWVLWRSKISSWLKYIIGFHAIISFSLSALVPFVGRMGLPYYDGYNIYWRKILKFLRIDLIEDYISLDFLNNPTYYDYSLGICIFIILIIGGILLKNNIINKEIKNN